MKIGIDARLWNESGVGRYIRNLMKGLSVLDTENNYVLFALSSDVESIKNQIARNKKNWKIVEANIRWHTLSEQMRFPSLLQKEQLDLVHFPYFSVPIYYSGKFVVTIHDLILHHYPTGQATTLPLPLYHAKRMGYKFIIAQAAKRAVKIITVSQATKEEIVKRLHVNPEKVVVTYEGVDGSLYSSSESKTNREVLSKISSRLRSNNNYFLYVGNAYPHKNLERLLEAFTMASKHTDSKLVLVGKEDFFYKRLQKKVENMGLQDNVIFAGYVSDDDLASLYHYATALIAPSVMEGFSLPPLEAMAQKCLVIASDIPVHREICTDAAIYFNPKSTNDLINKMRSVLEKTQNTDRYIINGKKRVNDFSWDKMAKETLIVYNNAL